MIENQLTALEQQEIALRDQADAILEQLTMTKGAVQILRKLLVDIEHNKQEEGQTDGDTGIDGNS
jgi:hypothetical protein